MLRHSRLPRVIFALHDGNSPREELIEHKNPELAMQLEYDPQWEELILNHLEGRTAAFFCHGDNEANEEGQYGRPKKLRPQDYFDPGSAPFDNERDAYAPLDWQCRYSGIEVPDEFWASGTSGAGLPTEYLTLKVSQTQENVRFGNRVTLVVDLVPSERVHVYAPPMRLCHPAKTHFFLRAVTFLSWPSLNTISTRGSATPNNY